MKKYFIFPLVVILIGCSVFIWMMYDSGLFGGIIKQEFVPQTFYAPRCYATYVWKNGEIIYSWYDPMDSLLIHPEIPTIRHKQAEKILESINH